MDEQVSVSARQKLLQHVLELEAKALNYLLVANGAGLAGCLATLKDYATVPQLHGVGTLIVIFSVGLAAAAVSFLLFQLGSFEMMRRDDSPARGKFSLAVMNHLMSFSGACFIFGIFMIAKKLASL